MAKETSAPSPAKRIAALREGPAAVQAWNRKVAKGPKKFRKADLAEAKLSHVVLAGLDFSAAVFDQATLYQAHFEGTILTDASLKKANLKSARFDRANLGGADFSEADLSKANLTCANLQRANLTGAKLDKADLAFADLRGADLTAASLVEANLMGISTDASTKLPAGIAPAPSATDSKSPLSSAGPAKVSSKKRVDLPTFMKRLADKSDPGRFERALKMLKRGKIQLFTDVTPEHVVGVVQSQSRDDTVYSCHLRNDGKFACVTTDLENCMGLGEGKPCKHLLVLLIGLVHSGQFDPGTAMLWVSTKAKKGTRKDTNVLADTLIRYKGALAGEVDWRPTETLPEDFYAF